MRYLRKAAKPLVVVATILVMLLIADVARADIRDWSEIVDEAKCRAMTSGAPVGVYIDGEQVAMLEPGSGDTYENPGPVTVEVRVYLQRDNVETASFVFDCNEVPPSSSTTTTTTLSPPDTTLPPAPAPTTTTEPPPVESTTTTAPPTVDPQPPVKDPDPQPEVKDPAPPVETIAQPTNDEHCGPNTLPCTGWNDTTRTAAAIGSAALLLGLLMLAAAHWKRP